MSRAPVNDRERAGPALIRVSWLAALFGLAVGVTMTYVPYEFQAPLFEGIYPKLRPLGIAFALGGGAMGAAALYPRLPRVVAWGGRLVFLGALAYYWWYVNILPRGMTGAIIYPLMMVAVVVEALPARRHRGVLPWFMGAVALSFGALFLLSPGLLPAAIFGPLLPLARLEGLMFLAVGVALIVTRRRPTGRLVYGALLVPFVILAWSLARVDSWSGMELYLVLSLGCALAMWSPPVHTFRSVRWQLLRSLTIAAILPLLLLGGAATYIAQRAIEHDLRATTRKTAQIAATDASRRGDTSADARVWRFDRQGQQLEGGELTIPASALLAAAAGEVVELFDSTHTRVLVAGAAAADGDDLVVVAFPIAGHLVSVTRLGGAVAGAVVIATLLTLVLAVLVSRDLVERLGRVQRAAAELAAGGAPVASIAMDTEDEIGALATSFDRMAARIQEKIAEQARTEEALREADRRKDEFLAMLGHELRNPLAALRSGLALIERAGPAELPRLQAVCERQVTVLRRMVDDLLDVSRITRGKVELRRERVELTSVVEQAVQTMRQALDERGQALRVSLAPGPHPVEGDATRLEQVIVNLLSNASKFTPSGGSVTVSVESVEEDGRPWARVCVRDTGRGIAPELLPRIYDLFVQGNAGLDRREAGLGIGLTLARSLVSLQGGTIAATSDGVGRGSCFTVLLPVVEARPELIAEAAPAAEPGAGELGSEEAPGPARRRIVLVDDNADALELTEELLREWGHEVLTASDGLRGRDLILDEQPDIALVDIGLPGLDGYRVAESVRPRVGTYLVAVTGYGDREARERARAAGFDRHVAKPVDLDELEALLSEGLVSRR